MAGNPTDAVPQILIKIQDGISSLRSELGQFKLENQVQHDRMESLIRKQRRDAAGMLVMMRATASDFDERVNEVEERVAALEAKTS
jgi:polyhydroxyalkanoate synthesis regulator phasin